MAATAGRYSQRILNHTDRGNKKKNLQRVQHLHHVHALLGLREDLGVQEHLGHQQVQCYPSHQQHQLLRSFQHVQRNPKERKIIINTFQLLALDSKFKKNISWPTIIEGEQQAPFSITTKLRCRRGHYSFPWIAPRTLDLHLIMLNVNQGGIKNHFSVTRLGIEPWSPGLLANIAQLTLIILIYRTCGNSSGRKNEEEFLNKKG